MSSELATDTETTEPQQPPEVQRFFVADVGRRVLQLYCDSLEPCRDGVVEEITIDGMYVKVKYRWMIFSCYEWDEAKNLRFVSCRESA